MGLIHERLYQTEDLDRPDFAEYIGDFVNMLFHSYSLDAATVRPQVRVENVVLDVDLTECILPIPASVFRCPPTR